MDSPQNYEAEERGGARRHRSGISVAIALAAFFLLTFFFAFIWQSVKDLLTTLETGSLDENLVFISLGFSIMVSIAIVLVVYFIISRNSPGKNSRELFASHERFRLLYDQSPVPYLLITEEGRIKQPNKAALRLYGATANDLEGQWFFGMHPDEDLANAEQFFKHFQETNVVNNKEIRVKRGDGSVRWVLLSIFVGAVGGGNKTGLVVLVDITDRKILEAKLERQVHETEKFKQAVDFSTDGVVIASPDGAIRYVNEAWTSLTGYSAEEALGQPQAFTESGKTPTEVLARLDATLASGTPFASEDFIMKRKNGVEFNARFSVYPVLGETDGAALFFVGILEDISKRKEIDRAKTEFVSLASHQLRSPLGVVKWYTEILQSGKLGPLNDEQKKYIDAIHRSNQRLVEIVGVLLNVSRIELGSIVVRFAEFDFVGLCEGVLEDLNLAIQERKIVIEKEYGGAKALPFVSDERLVQAIVANLVSNAVKYTPENGTVRLILEADQSGIKLSVADTGYGIPPEQQAHLFTKMFRATNTAHIQGIGLGLYVVKSFVQLLGGDIAFLSEMNKGTTFMVTLPRQAPSVVPESVVPMSEARAISASV